MSSAFFDDATLSRGVIGSRKSKSSKAKAKCKPQNVREACGYHPISDAIINDPALDGEVKAFRTFERDEIEPLALAVPVYFRPKSTAGLVCVAAVGCYVAASDVAKFRANMREIAFRRGMYRRDHLAACFTAAIVDNAMDEAAALVASCLNFHDDRGDGLLHVPALREKRAREAWARACAALGIKSKCRACLR